MKNELMTISVTEKVRAQMMSEYKQSLLDAERRGSTDYKSAMWSIFWTLIAFWNIFVSTHSFINHKANVLDWIGVTAGVFLLLLHPVRVVKYFWPLFLSTKKILRKMRAYRIDESSLEFQQKVLDYMSNEIDVAYNDTENEYSRLVQRIKSWKNDAGLLRKQIEQLADMELAKVWLIKLDNDEIAIAAAQSSSEQKKLRTLAELDVWQKEASNFRTALQLSIKVRNTDEMAQKIVDLGDQAVELVDDAAILRQRFENLQLIAASSIDILMDLKNDLMATTNAIEEVRELRQMH